MLGKVNIKTIIKGIISLALLGWVLLSIPFSQLMDQLANIEVAWLLAGAFWIVLAIVVSTIKWGTLLKPAGTAISWWFIWKSYWIGQFFNNFLPSSIGGDAMRIYLVAKETNDPGEATASVVFERLLATIGLAILGLIITPYTSIQNKSVTGIFSFLLIIGCLLLVLLMSPSVLKVLLRAIPIKSQKFRKSLETALHYGLKLRAQPKAILTVIFWSVMFQFCVVMVNYCIFKALHINTITLIDAVYLIPATSVAAMIPIGINGYGVRENAYVMLFAPLQVAKASAVTASLLFAILISICSIYGGLLWVKEGVKEVYNEAY